MSIKGILEERCVEHSFAVNSKDDGERIDRFLCNKLPKLSRKQIKGLIDGGRVSVGRRRVVIASWELVDGDQVEVRIPTGFESRPVDEASEERSQKGSRESRHHVTKHSEKIGSSIDRYLERQKSRAQREREERAKDGKGRKRKRGRGGEEKGEERGRRGREERLKIYHQDRDVIVVEKPAGILSVPSEGGGKASLKDLVKSYMKRKIKGSKGSFVAPLHRLDAETSGIMVFALSKVGQKLSGQFKNHTVERIYQAVVAGRIEKESGVIDRPLEKGDFGHGKKSRSSSEGRRAVTEYTVRERYSHATLIDVRVRTGRTHQIRVHLADEGHPVIGDSVYSREGAAAKAKEIPFSRHALHAHSLAFKHPASGQRIFHRSPLPKDMQELVDRLREGS